MKGAKPKRLAKIERALGRLFDEDEAREQEDLCELVARVGLGPLTVAASERGD